MTSNGTWRFCEQSNTTFVDCPIADLDLEEGAQMFVGLHNPSSLNI